MRRTPVAHVVFPRPSTLRPVPEFAWDAVRAIGANRGFDLEVLMPVPSRWARKLSSASRRGQGARAWPEGLEAALAALDPAPTLIPYMPAPRRSVESAALAVTAQLIGRPRAGRPAVIEGSFLDEGGFVASVAARALGVASLAVAHGSDVRAADANAALGGRGRRARHTLKNATEVIAVSHDLASQIARLGRRADVLPFTASAKEFTLARRAKGPPVVLFVGRVEKAKGADILLAAFARLKHPAARLRLVGPIVDVDARGAADRLGIADRVDVIGEVPKEDLPAHYASATCLVLPSQAEGLACVLVEALLVGRPVIATDVGGTREVIDDDVGALVPAGDAALLAIKIADVIERVRSGALDPAALRERGLPLSWASTGPRLEALTWRLARG